MSDWPLWDSSQAASLARYVLPTEVAAKLAGLPGRDGSDELGRLRHVYKAFAAAGVRYAWEPLSDDPRRQAIRTPDEVLRAPGEATCLDAAVVFAGACLHAGLHPLIVIARPPVPGATAHAVVAVWLGGRWAGHAEAGYPRRGVLVEAHDDVLVEELRATIDRPGEFVAVDLTAATYQAQRSPGGFEEAAAQGARVILGGGWQEWVGVDVGLDWDAASVHQPPRWPGRGDQPPLHSPYVDPAALAARDLRLLRAEYGVVPWQGRDELEVLLDWFRRPPGPDATQIALVTGVGGAGKTRLAAEVAHRLATEGWYTGFARPPIDKDDATTDALAGWLEATVCPLLVIMDYAEARAADVSRLLQSLQARPGTPAGLLLTAREQGQWTKQIEKELRRGRHATRIEPVGLPALHPNPSRVYRRAVERLSQRFGAPQILVPPPSMELGWTTLDLVMLAWLAALGADRLPTSRKDLYEEVLDHERAFWDDTYHAHTLADATRGGIEDLFDQALFDQAAACLTLVGPPRQRAPEVLRAIPDLAKNPKWRHRVSVALGECLSSWDGQLGVKPDPIADHLLLDVFRGRPELCVSCFAYAEEQERLNGLLTLTRAAGLNPDTAAYLAERAITDIDGLWQPALRVAEAVGGPCVNALVALSGHDDTPLPLRELAEGIPLGHANLRPISAAAAQRLLVDHDRQGGDPAERARWLNTLSNRLADVGRRDEALEAITEAVTLLRRLAQANPSGYLSKLATSVNNLSARLADVGRRQEALDAVTEAVTLRRRLAQANPAAYLPDLAISLNNQANMLADVGRRDEALDAVTEAVTLHRGLAQANPAAYLPDLAMSLYTQAAMLAEVGRREEALDAVTEAVTYYRHLSQANPAAYLPNLAISLNNQATALSGVGRRDEALDAIIKAVTYYRHLSQANPAAFLPDLAALLSNQSLILSEVGRREEALDAVTEAVTLHRGLAQANPAAYLPNLATSLNNHAKALSGVGLREEAVDAITEAVTHYRGLTQANPAAHLPNLAESLSNQANMLMDIGRREEALDAITEAVTHYRHLSQANPAAYLPNLAGSLNNQAIVLSEVGRREEALDTSTEATNRYRHLTRVSPATFTPNLAMSLNNQSLRLSEVGRREEALDTITEAVTLRRRLAQTNPAAFLSDLAGSLHNQSLRLSEVGRCEEALDTSTEATNHYRHLTQVDSAAFVPDLAMSLSNQAARLADVGRCEEALDTSTEATNHYRHLAQATPDAFLPDLAMSLHNLSNALAGVGRREEALDTIIEAVTLRRRLAQAHPGAYLPDLAMSLNNQANRLADVGRREEALDAITEAADHYRRLVLGDLLCDVGPARVGVAGGAGWVTVSGGGVSLRCGR